MTMTDFRNLLESEIAFKGKVAYRAFPINEAPPLPFIVFFYQNDEHFLADNKVYYRKQAVQVELYTKDKDESVEEKLEAVLEPFIWSKETIYLDDEACYETIYNMEV